MAARRLVLVYDRRREEEKDMARTLWTAALILGFVLAMSMTRRRAH